MKRNVEDAAAFGLAAAAVTALGVMLMVFIFGLGIGITSLLVWIANWGLNVAFGVAMLGFTKTCAVGVVVMVVRALFTTTQVKTS